MRRRAIVPGANSNSPVVGVRDAKGRRCLAHLLVLGVVAPLQVLVYMRPLILRQYPSASSEQRARVSLVRLEWSVKASGVSAF